VRARTEVFELVTPALSGPVTYDAEPATGVDERNKITDPQPTKDELLQT
jgi:hypothetical protein